MTPILAFDIETVPDVRGIRTLYDLPSEVADAEVVEFARQKRRARTGSDFMQHHLQQVVAISCCMRWGQDKIHVGTIGEIGDDEETVIARFFELIETHTPQLVSWNGGGFDLPVLHYRALIHGITAARYWDMGEGDFGQPRFQMEQLHQPLSQPPLRLDGLARPLPAPCQCAFGRYG